MNMPSTVRRAGQVIWEGLVQWGLWAGGHPLTAYWYHERELWLRHNAGADPAGWVRPATGARPEAPMHPLPTGPGPGSSIPDGSVPAVPV